MIFTVTADARYPRRFWLHCWSTSGTRTRRRIIAASRADAERQAWEKYIPVIKLTRDLRNSGGAAA